MHIDVPPPSSRFLLLHAPVAKVLSASGRAENVDRVCREFEVSEGLCANGSSSETLASALSMYLSTLPSTEDVIFPTANPNVTHPAYTRESYSGPSLPASPAFGRRKRE
jgi:hypothetical protein